MFIGSYRLENLLSLLPVIFVVMFFLRVFWQNRGNNYQSLRGTDTNTSDKTPEDILKERFARGDIDEAEYKRRMDVLKNQ